MTPKPNKSLLPYLLIMYEVVLYLSNDMYLPSMPNIASELMLTEHQIQATLTLWFLGASSLQLILGPISDRYGRRIVILVGASAFIIASVFCALANSITTLFIARLVQGGSVCTLVAGYAAVHESFNTKKAIKLFAIIGAITVLAPALGPLFGSIIVQFANWRFIFWFLAIFCLINLVLQYMFLPETNKRRETIKLKRIAKDYYKIITNKNFLIPCTSYFFLVSIEFLWAFESPFIIMEVYEKSILFYGMAQTAIFGFFILGAGFTKWLLDFYNIKILITAGLIISIIGTTAFLFIATYKPTIVLGISSMMIIALGSSMLVAPLTRLTLESCRQATGMVTAVFSMATNLSGVAVGVLLIFNKTNSLYNIASTAFILIILAALLITRLTKRYKKSYKFKRLF